MSTDPAPTALMARPNSAGAVRDFLTEASGSGALSGSTAKALRTALTTVLQTIESDSWAEFDMAGADEDQVFKRFTNRTGNKYTPATQQAYKTRFHQARAMYLAREAGDPNWVQVGRVTRERSQTPKGSAGPARTRGADRSTEPAVLGTGIDAGVSAAGPRPAMLAFPIPIRPGVQGQLVLPADLTAGEARRICAVVTALAQDEGPAIAQAPPSAGGAP